jgi:hypothetical protein
VILNKQLGQTTVQGGEVTTMDMADNASLRPTAALLFTTLPHQLKLASAIIETDYTVYESDLLTQLVEADVLSVLAEALTAHVQLVLADQSLLVRADHAAARALAHADLLARTPLVEMAHSD